MGTIWGPATEIKELGVVAEQCPRCDRTTPCRVRAAGKGFHVFFMRVKAAARETSCVCTACGEAFPCRRWRYPDLVPAQEAGTLSLDALLARTNPGLVERAQLKQQVSALGGDARFTATFEQLEEMRPGGMHAELLKRLLDWARLEEDQRNLLVKEVAAWAHGWKFAQQVAAGFPIQAGCLPAALAALGIWSAFLWAPVVRDWLWGTVTVVAGFGAAALVGHVLLGREVRRWTREVLVPGAQRANIPLVNFLIVVDDLSGSPMSVMEDLWPVKDQLDTIRTVLARDGKV